MFSLVFIPLPRRLVGQYRHIGRRLQIGGRHVRCLRSLEGPIQDFVFACARYHKERLACRQQQVHAAGERPARDLILPTPVARITQDALRSQVNNPGGSIRREGGSFNPR